MARVVQTPDRLAALAAHRVPPREEFSEAPAPRTPPRTPQQAQMALPEFSKLYRRKHVLHTLELPRTLS